MSNSAGDCRSTSGLRYEYFGVMHNTDRSQGCELLLWVEARRFRERLANGALRSTKPNPGDLKGQLYRPDFLNLAPSIGLAWDVRGTGHTVLRAGYSVAVDRILDTVRDLRSNYQQIVDCSDSLHAELRGSHPADCSRRWSQPTCRRGDVVQLDANLRTPYAQNWYAGVQQTVTPNLLIEIGHAGSVGRKLISRDVINRSTLTPNLRSTRTTPMILSCPTTAIPITCPWKRACGAGLAGDSRHRSRTPIAMPLTTRVTYSRAAHRSAPRPSWPWRPLHASSMPGLTAAMPTSTSATTWS